MFHPGGCRTVMTGLHSSEMVFQEHGGREGFGGLLLGCTEGCPEGPRKRGDSDFPREFYLRFQNTPDRLAQVKD